MATDPLKPIFYVYQHRKADSGEIFYIGKGMGRRAYDSFHRSKNKERNNRKIVFTCNK